MRPMLRHGLGLAFVASGIGCASATATNAPAGAPTAPTYPAEVRGMRVRVAPEVAIVLEGDHEPNLSDRLRAAVEAELALAGITLVAAGNEASDLVLRIETRVKSAVYFLRGHVGLTAESAGAPVAQVTTEVALHSDSEFPSAMAKEAVGLLLRSPTLVSLAKKKHPQQETTASKAVVARPMKAAAPAQPSPAAKAKSHYLRGTSYYNLNRFREALAEYEAAYMAVQDPPFLFDIAQCYRKLGEDKQAIDFYRSYLRTAPNAPNRGEVQKRISELERGER